MIVGVFEDKHSLSKAAAEQASAAVRGAIHDRGCARIIVATGTSQLDFLDELTSAKNIDWQRVEMFHLENEPRFAYQIPLPIAGCTRSVLLCSAAIERSVLKRQHEKAFPLPLGSIPWIIRVVMQMTSYSYRFASEVLDSQAFHGLKQDILNVFTAIHDVPQLNPPKTRKRGGRSMIFTTDQLALNTLIDTLFKDRGWESKPLVTDDGVTNIRADFKKGRVQVEVQFGNMARWYTDVFKFQVSYSLGLIDVGVLVAPMQAFSNTIDENVAHYERIIRELPYAKMSLTLPIWVVGIQP